MSNRMLREVAIPASRHDLMTSCEDRWVSDYTFARLATRIAAENAAVAR